MPFARFGRLNREARGKICLKTSWRLPGFGTVEFQMNWKRLLRIAQAIRTEHVTALLQGHLIRGILNASNSRHDHEQQHRQQFFPTVAFLDRLAVVSGTSSYDQIAH
jgi:hypothetical protein